ncbi:hypothetical protein NE237_000891 [Protea cynaroides]|uniref:Uncharacterized protein n=1 Tax=Protea cynaroides TaxID=273540 RepID=A0A9Q0KSB4_9MAGN|nr:hypothetical protein NE237_000891 [Protea cynaroides]
MGTTATDFPFLVGATTIWVVCQPDLLVILTRNQIVSYGKRFQSLIQGFGISLTACQYIRGGSIEIRPLTGNRTAQDDLIADHKVIDSLAQVSIVVDDVACESHSEPFLLFFGTSKKGCAPFYVSPPSRAKNPSNNRHLLLRQHLCEEEEHSDFSLEEEDFVFEAGTTSSLDERDLGTSLIQVH